MHLLNACYLQDAALYKRRKRHRVSYSFPQSKGSPSEHVGYMHMTYVMCFLQKKKKRF